MSDQNRTTGNYIGTMPEDIYIRLGEIWDGDEGPLRVTKKTYITNNKMDYDIQVLGLPPEQKNDAPKTLKTYKIKTSAPYVMPLPPNLKPGTPEVHLSIGIGDTHTSYDGITRTVVGKTFRLEPSGLIAIEVIYE